VAWDEEDTGFLLCPVVFPLPPLLPVDEAVDVVPTLRRCLPPVVLTVDGDETSPSSVEVMSSSWFSVVVEGVEGEDGEDGEDEDEAPEAVECAVVVGLLPRVGVVFVVWTVVEGEEPRDVEIVEWLADIVPFAKSSSPSKFI